MARSFASIALALALGPAGFSAAAETAPSPAAPVTVSVMVEGAVPGFSQDQLDLYVVREMTAANAGPWQFTPDPKGAPAPNRIVWHFRLLPYAGGTVRYIGPMVNKVEGMFGVRRAVGIDAKVYLGNQYQTSTFDQVSIRGGGEDDDLGHVIQRVLRSIVANAQATLRLPGGALPPGTLPLKT